MSYKNSDKNKPTVLARKKKNRKYWIYFLSVFSVAIIFYGTYFWSNHIFFKINEVEIKGNYHVSRENILEVYEKNSTLKKFWFFGQQNFIFLPRTNILEEIQKFLPIEEVDLTFNGINKITIDVKEYEPFAIWCQNQIGTNISENLNSNCFLVNKYGVLFAESPKIILQDLMILYGQIVEDSKLGQKYSDEKFFENLLDFKKLVQKINIAILSVKTDDGVSFILKTKNGPEIFIDDNDKPVEIANNLKTLLEQESIHEVQFKNLQYVDLRFDGKAYYKIK